MSINEGELEMTAAIGGLKADNERNLQRAASERTVDHKRTWVSVPRMLRNFGQYSEQYRSTNGKKNLNDNLSEFLEVL